MLVPVCYSSLHSKNKFAVPGHEVSSIEALTEVFQARRQIAKRDICPTRDSPVPFDTTESARTPVASRRSDARAESPVSRSSVLSRAYCDVE